MDRQELLRRMRAGRADLEGALARVDDRQMDDVILHGAWSVKDLLTHLGFWERRVVARYQALAAGESWTGVSDEAGMDRLNAQAWQEGRRRSLEEVRQEEAAAWQAILALATNAPEEHLFGSFSQGGADDQNLFQLIEGNTYGHYDEHLPELHAWLDRQRA